MSECAKEKKAFEEMPKEEMLRRLHALEAYLCELKHQDEKRQRREKIEENHRLKWMMNRK